MLVATAVSVGVHRPVHFEECLDCSKALEGKHNQPQVDIAYRRIEKNMLNFRKARETLVCVAISEFVCSGPTATGIGRHQET